jgi:S-adenosylmethionine hydrolase
VDAKPIVLLTDFGTADPFVGIMKAVIHDITPNSNLIDLSHEIPPGDIRQAAITLWQAHPYLPRECVILGVVDPGVGTARRGIAARAGGRSFVGPDNGLFSYVLPRSPHAWELADRGYQLDRPGETFHGRDIFAPAAAHISRGVHPQSFGPEVLSPVSLPFPYLETSEQGIHGEILHADRFGNLLTSIGRCIPEGNIVALHPWQGSSRGAALRFSLETSEFQLPDQRQIPWAHTFGEIPDGQCAAVIGSSGLLEIAANRQSASEILNLHAGDPVHILLSEGRTGSTTG